MTVAHHRGQNPDCPIRAHIVVKSSADFVGIRFRRSLTPRTEICGVVVAQHNAFGADAGSSRDVSVRCASLLGSLLRLVAEFRGEPLTHSAIHQFLNFVLGAQGHDFLRQSFGLAYSSRADDGLNDGDLARRHG